MRIKIFIEVLTKLHYFIVKVHYNVGKAARDSCFCNFAIVSIICLFLLFSCKKADEKILLPLTKAEISGDRLWRRINEEQNYHNYPFWPGHQGFQPGQEPHGTIHKVYLNSILYNALPLVDKITPLGSIVIKENYNANKELMALTVMVKVKDYNPEHNDWYWVKYDSKGKTLDEGNITACIECHSPMKPNDYIIIRPLDKPLE